MGSDLYLNPPSPYYSAWNKEQLEADIKRSEAYKALERENARLRYKLGEFDVSAHDGTLRKHLSDAALYLRECQEERQLVPLIQKVTLFAGAASSAYREMVRIANSVGEEMSVNPANVVAGTGSESAGNVGDR